MLQMIVSFRGCPVSLPAFTGSMLREGMKYIIIEATELIVGPSIMCFVQIDSSKFIMPPCPFQIYTHSILHREPFEQLLPRNMKKAKNSRLIIATQGKDVYAIFAGRCLSDTEAMDLLKNEFYDKTNDTQEQMNSSHTEQNCEDMWWNSKTFHSVCNIHKFQRRQTESLSYVYLFEIVKDPFLDICSFVEESELDMLEKRALVTKDTNITARVYENWLSKGEGNDIQIHQCKSN